MAKKRLSAVWTKTDDQHLMVTVQRYGTMDWNRIACCIGKTAMECRSRFSEITTTPWTLEEDQKLVHLAKILIPRWQTISDLIGNKGARQCWKRYDELVQLGLEVVHVAEVVHNDNDAAIPSDDAAIPSDDAELQLLVQAETRVSLTKGRRAKRVVRQKTIELRRRLHSMNRKMDETRVPKPKGWKLKRKVRVCIGLGQDDSCGLFCGNLGEEVTDDVLAEAFLMFPSFYMARVFRDKKTGKSHGCGCVSFFNPSDLAKALKQVNGKYVGSQPISLLKRN